MDGVLRVLKRAGRAAVATFVSTLVATVPSVGGHAAWFIPPILALGKALREKFPKLSWLPF